MNLATTSLGEIAEVAAGGGAPQNADAFTAEGTPFIRAGSLNPLVNGASESTLEHLTDEVAKEHGLRKFPRDTVVFAKSGMSATKGHVYRLRDEAFVVNHLAAIVPTQRVVPEFLEHSLRVFSPVRLIQDAAYPSVRLSDVATMRIPLPPLAEQRRIAEVLDRAEALRAKRRAALAQLDSLTQSLFLDLFGDPISNSRKWPQENLETFFHFRTGKLDSNAAVALGQYPFFTCSREDFRIDTFAFDCEALLLAGNNANADYSVKHYRGKFNAYQRTYVITLRDERNSYNYSRFVLEHRLGDLKRMSKGTGTKYLTMELLNQIRVPIPPISLQREFALRVTAAEALKTVQRASLAELDALFATLQYRAFRGELFA